MKFILKDGLVHIVDNPGFHNNNIEVEIELLEIEPTRVDYKINNGEYRQLKENKLVIPKEVLKSTAIDIVVRVFKDKDVFYYKSDTIPLTQSVIFGGTIQDFYPAVIKDLYVKYDSILEVIKNLLSTNQVFINQTKEELINQLSNTQHELKDTMVELVETFEEITKKGSLF